MSFSLQVSAWSGRERDRSCLVDCCSVLEFDKQLEELKMDWSTHAPGFFEYFQKNKAQKVKDFYLVDQRQLLNLGGSSGRTTTNPVEAINNLLKQQQSGKKLPLHEMIRSLQKYSEMALHKLSLAVIEGKGGVFQLKAEYRDFTVSDIEFKQMNAGERAEHWRSVCLGPPGFGFGTGISMLGLKMPKSIPDEEVTALAERAKKLASDVENFRQSQRFPHIFQV